MSTIEEVKEEEDERDTVRTKYDIQNTAKWIIENDFKRIAIQIPDEILPDAAEIARAIIEETTATKPSINSSDSSNTRVNRRNVFVLADTTFGACCIDEVAAMHHEADCVVHLGYSCLSRTSELPARVVFEQEGLDVDKCVDMIKRFDFGSECEVVCVLVEQNRSRFSDQIREKLSFEKGGERMYLVSSQPVETIEPIKNDIDIDNDAEVVEKEEEDVVNDDDNDKNSNYNKRKIKVELGAMRIEYDLEFDETFRNPSKKAFIWIGDDNSPALTHALVTISSASSESSAFRTNYDIARYCPKANEIEPKAIGTEGCRRNVKKRNHAIERAKDSKIVGIVVGTLGVSGYLSIVSKLREMIETSGRTCYTVACGKPNPNKLANFPEIETFVLVACEMCALVDAKEYLQAVITPHEAALAFGNKPWVGEVKLDFKSFKDETKDFTQTASKEPSMSLLTGSLRKDSSAGDGVDDDDADYDSESANVSRILIADDDNNDTDDNDKNLLEANAFQLAKRASHALAFRENMHLSTNISTHEPRSGAEYLLTKRTFVGLDPNKKKDKVDEETGKEVSTEHPLLATQGSRGRAAAYDSDIATVEIPSIQDL